jgi:hypothetical protein
MAFKIDLHTHTRRYSWCSQLSPDTLCETALACGLDAVAITEHHRQWSPGEIAELQARYPSLKLYAGVEITCTDRRDYVVLGLDAGPYSEPMDVSRLQALLDDRTDTFCFVAHCFRYSRSASGLAELKIDGIEMASYNLLDRRQPAGGPVRIVRRALYETWQGRMGWIPLYNSDAHSAAMVGLFCNLVEAPHEAPDGVPGDERALARLLREAQIRPVENRARIRAMRR